MAKKEPLLEPFQYAHGCPCLYTTPCHPQCTCTHPGSSRGCMRCCLYGSITQRTAHAKALAEIIDKGILDALMGNEENS